MLFISEKMSPINFLILALDIINYSGEKMKNQIKYIVAVVSAVIFMAFSFYYPAQTFLAFFAGWLFLIPAAFIIYMVYGLVELRKESVHRITVTIKPTEAMKALTRREAVIRKEKERLLYEEFGNELKQ